MQTPVARVGMAYLPAAVPCTVNGCDGKEPGTVLFQARRAVSDVVMRLFCPEAECCAQESENRRRGFLIELAMRRDAPDSWSGTGSFVKLGQICWAPETSWDWNGFIRVGDCEESEEFDSDVSWHGAGGAPWSKSFEGIVVFMDRDGEGGQDDRREQNCKW
jgi:hypothetical protein